MVTRSNRPVPARAIHPGEILREELKERGITQKDFAREIDMLPAHLNEVIKGKRSINPSLAMKLEKHLGIPYKSWMSIQNGYDYDTKSIAKKNNEQAEAADFESACSKLFNLNLLYKTLGIKDKLAIERTGKLKGLVPFDLLSVREYTNCVTGFYRHSEKVQIDEKNMLTWLVLNLISISNLDEMETRYTKGDGEKAAQEIALLANGQILTTEKIKDILAKYGIYYLHVQKIDKAPVDAYSTMWNKHPVITVTYRYNDMDKLAFDVLHELCHIDCHLNTEVTSFISVDGMDYSRDPREKEANDFAKETLIPGQTWKKILNVGTKSLNPNKIVGLIALEAKKYDISPSIAVARYKHDTKWYRTSQFSSPKIH